MCCMYTHMYVCVCLCVQVFVCVFFFLSACEAPTTKSRFNFNENPICHECRMSRDPLFLLLDFELHKCIYSWSDKTDVLFPLASAYSTFSATIFHWRKQCVNKIFILKHWQFGNIYNVLEYRKRNIRIHNCKPIAGLLTHVPSTQSQAVCNTYIHIHMAKNRHLYINMTPFLQHFITGYKQTVMPAIIRSFFMQMSSTNDSWFVPWKKPAPCSSL